MRLFLLRALGVKYCATECANCILHVFSRLVLRGDIRTIVHTFGTNLCGTANHHSSSRVLLESFHCMEVTTFTVLREQAIHATAGYCYIPLPVHHSTAWRSRHSMCYENKLYMQQLGIVIYPFQCIIPLHGGHDIHCVTRTSYTCNSWVLLYTPSQCIIPLHGGHDIQCVTRTSYTCNSCWVLLYTPSQCIIPLHGGHDIQCVTRTSYTCNSWVLLYTPSQCIIPLHGGHDNHILTSNTQTVQRSCVTRVMMCFLD